VRPAPLDAATTSRLSRQRQRDTEPEMALRRAAHRLGLRYRVDAPLPLTGVRRRADMLFPRARVAAFLDGCAWHGCPLHRMRPRNNAQWWIDKLDANISRDRDTDRRLREAGWLSVRVWEHEDPVEAAARLQGVVLARLRSPSSDDAGPSSAARQNLDEHTE
jgi:DNA mismatch endonuclease (patch repair protein)